MAKQVEGISEKVELCAKKEFLEKGYVDASLRTIAAEAGTTTGTIYSRYGGKEGLFSAIVEPVAKEFTGIFIGVQEKFHAIESVLWQTSRMVGFEDRRFRFGRGWFAGTLLRPHHA